MLRRRWLPILFLTVVLAAGVTGGIVLAQNNGADGDTRADRVLDRVAEILGIGGTDLKNAFQLARGEISDEKIDKLLEELVDRGKLTQEESNGIRAWLDSQPGSLGKLDARVLRALLGVDQPHIAAARYRLHVGIGAATSTKALSEEAAAAITDWLDSFPESLAAVGISDLLKFSQAQVERRRQGEHPFPATPDGLVDAGVLTRQQADDLIHWLQRRPDVAGHTLPGLFRSKFPLGGQFFFESEKSERFGSHRMPRLFRGFGRFRLHPDQNPSRSFRFFEGAEELFPRYDDLLRRFRQFRDGGSLDELFKDLRADLQERFERDGVDHGIFEFRFGRAGERFRFEFPSKQEVPTPASENAT